ncbi:GntR family transcriptional regulator [Georgenia alba]|uniref:GntR family transcriptional regulator n=1 Tax=Georgenia alba TaxID=2233858 RepID=A0ABW2Q9X1_9MICO
MDRIRIDERSSVSPYEQVRSQIAARIADGTLAVGTRLPTVRSLAAELGLAVNTVARAYRELEEAGLVTTRRRAGTVVSAMGDHTRTLAQAAARRYAETVRGLGLGTEESLRIVRAQMEG